MFEVVQANNDDDARRSNGQTQEHQCCGRLAGIGAGVGMISQPSPAHVVVVEKDEDEDEPFSTHGSAPSARVVRNARCTTSKLNDSSVHGMDVHLDHDNAPNALAQPSTRTRTMTENGTHPCTTSNSTYDKRRPTNASYLSTHAPKSKVQPHLHVQHRATQRPGYLSVPLPTSPDSESTTSPRPAVHPVPPQRASHKAPTRRSTPSTQAHTPTSPLLSCVVHAGDGPSLQPTLDEHVPTSYDSPYPASRVHALLVRQSLHVQPLRVASSPSIHTLSLPTLLESYLSSTFPSRTRIISSPILHPGHMSPYSTPLPSYSRRHVFRYRTSERTTS
ncbi:hypothetical protein BDN70DRAFT_995577 [Pholiota conissans]|uniref:Uncharacterized protein n=1 Tax=Pholiota conissans TaxID=109636 RepID=A0A9P6CRT7_9AGAR|nr:hypothetical protein BDN70DRAFT_995577 [Pholiota conissans]